MIDKALLGELERILSPNGVSAGAVASEVYSYDASTALGAPDAVVFPVDTAETAAVVVAAGRAGAACTPRGFGTNLTGGSVAPRGGIVVCTSRMNRILSIEPGRRCAIAQPGVTNLELQDAAAQHGFFFAPDPASQKVATLGGNVGENSGGPHCLKYGVTTNHVLGMEVVLPGGEVARFGGPALDPPGYDLRGLLMGSEGTLGIVTELALRILPKPESVVTLLAIYDSVADAAASVSGIIAEGIVPATLEMMDQLVINAVEDSAPCGYPRDAAAVLIIEVEGPAAGLKSQAQRIQRVCSTHGCRDIREAQNDAERDQLWAGRRGAFGAIARVAPNYHVADCTVPRTALPEALDRVAEISKASGFQCGNVFHAGDGNLHPLLLFDARDEGQTHRVHEAAYEIMQACVHLGGTITGEHGVGLEKIDAMKMVFSDDDLHFQQTLCHAVDPDDLFNPGKVLASVDEAEPSEAPCPPPEAALRPCDEAEACEMVRAAFANRTALLPLGSGRRARSFGNASERTLLPLHSAGLAGVIEYDAANQVATFGAGTALAAAQEVLSEHNQWLPLRPRFPRGATLGGVVALRACGPERLAYGGPRDRLLGLRFVSGQGRAIHAGGKVVKNVAGYDMTRLLTGSAGTLGFLTQVTFRVATIPDARRVVRGTGSLEQCATAADLLLCSKLEPAFVAAAPESTGWALSVGFEGQDVTVQAQADTCTSVLVDAGVAAGGPIDYPILEGVHGERFGIIFDSPFVVRVDLPLGAAAGFASGAADLLRGTNVLVDFGCGRVTAGVDGLSDGDWAQVCALAGELGGHAILEQTLDEFKAQHDVFGPARPEWELMHKLKAALDPRDIFAPGRMPGRR